MLPITSPMVDYLPLKCHRAAVGRPVPRPDLAMFEWPRAAPGQRVNEAEVVLEAGGRFYYAKDAVLLASSFARVHGDEAAAKFRALKQKWDPDRRLQTDLSRRMGV
ncbi:MAG: hypothetical protein IT456_05535 [Planctomycetes bacterium]|nr:hypothetical protein [Planctomycetota bacterium]